MQKFTITVLGLALCISASSLMAQEDGEKKNDFRNKLLEKYDKDGDGKLNEAEREAARAEFSKQAPETKPQDAPTRNRARIDGDRREGRRGGFNREEMEARRAEFMKRYDKDGDGEINEEERAAMREEFEKRREEARAEMLKQYDKDGDGEMSEEERTAAREDMRNKYQEITKKHDKDGDGRLSREEREAAREAGAFEGMVSPFALGRGPRGRGDGEGRRGRGDGESRPDRPRRPEAE